MLSLPLRAMGLGTSLRMCEHLTTNPSFVFGFWESQRRAKAENKGPILNSVTQSYKHVLDIIHGGFECQANETGKR